MGLIGRLTGRKIRAGYATPANYTPTPAGAESTTKISAHLKGIDQALAGSGGGGGMSWQVITANTAAVTGNGYLIVASSNVTLTLPASPSVGDKVGVKDADRKATTYTLTVARNGSNIEGSATDLVIDTDGSGFTLVYVNATVGWVVVTEIAGPGSGPGQYVSGYQGWATEVEVTADTALTTNDLGKLYRYTSSTSADRTLTLPAVGSGEDGHVVWVQNESAHVITVTPGDSSRVWTSPSGRGIELLPTALVCIRYDHNRTTWDVVNKSGGLVRQEDLRLLCSNNVTVWKGGGVNWIQCVDDTERHAPVGQSQWQISRGSYIAPPRSYVAGAGNSAYVDISDSPDWDVFASTSGIAIVALWIRPSRLSTTEVFYCHYQDSNNYWIFYKNASNAVCLDLKGGGSYQFQISGGSIGSTSSWYHITFARVGSNVGVYLNGQQVAYQLLASTWNFSGKLFIGQNGAGAHFYEGYMQDMLISYANCYGANPNSGKTDTLSDWNHEFQGVMQ